MKLALQAREDFEDLRYFKHNYNGAEYLCLTELTGNAFWFDITGYSNAMIFHTIAEIETGKKPSNMVIGNKAIMDIARSVK